MIFHLRNPAPLIAAAALLAGCGESMPSDQRPVLATIRGTLQVEPSTSDAEIRVALLWLIYDDSSVDQNSKHFVAQDVPVTSVTLPATFELAITDLPPENALYHGTAGGSVIAYRDLNHNGQLDFTPPDADHFIDEAVAWDDELWIRYVDPELNPGYTPGFSTSKGSIDTPVTLSEVPMVASCHLLEWDLKQPENAGPGPWGPILSVGMDYCPESPYSIPPGGAGVELGDGDGSPPPETSEVYCEESFGSSDPVAQVYTAYWVPEHTSDFVLATCGPLERSCHEGRDLSVMPPAAWPCPCDPSRYTCRDQE
jgi:hypothetical protein